MNKELLFEINRINELLNNKPLIIEQAVEKFLKNILTDIGETGFRNILKKISKQEADELLVKLKSGTTLADDEVALILQKINPSKLANNMLSSNLMGTAFKSTYKKYVNGLLKNPNKYDNVLNQLYNGIDSNPGLTDAPQTIKDALKKQIKTNLDNDLAKLKTTSQTTVNVNPVNDVDDIANRLVAGTNNTEPINNTLINDLVIPNIENIIDANKSNSKLVNKRINLDELKQEIVGQMRTKLSDFTSEISKLDDAFSHLPPSEQKKYIQNATTELKKHLPPTLFEKLISVVGLGFKYFSKLPPALKTAKIIWNLYIYTIMLRIASDLFTGNIPINPLNWKDYISNKLNILTLLPGLSNSQSSQSGGDNKPLIVKTPR